MNWIAVAKKDFRDAVQSRALWALVATFVLLSVVSTYAYVQVPEMFGSTGGATFAGLIFFTIGIISLFIPLTAVVVCYKSLAGERELGSIKLLLSLPINRLDVFIGKVIGRGSVLAFGLGVGLVVGFGFGSVLLGTIEIVPVLVFLVVTLIFAGIYGGIMVSISATTGSISRATTFAIGFFVVFELLWDVIPLAILYVVSGFEIPNQFPDWLFPLTQLPPSNAYLSSIVSLLPDTAEAVGAGTQSGVGVEVTTDTGESFLLSPEIGLVVLVLWLIVPLVIGYYRFNRADF